VIEIEKFNPFDIMTFSYDKCFLCGEELDNENCSEEHIYPKWLQRKFNLWNKTIDLLNGTKIQYKDLKIPCCRKCNGILSDMIEMPISEAVDAGFATFIMLDEKTIFQWLNKLAYGMLFKELSLKSDRSDPQSPSIYNEEYLKEHKMQFLFLQSIIYNSVFFNNPWSILIFKINPEQEEKYWAYENPFSKFFAIRLNDIGVIANLMDNGCLKDSFMQFEHMKELFNNDLHPIQFAELCAKLHYKTYLLNKTPYYTIAFHKNYGLQHIISHDISGSVVFSEWNQEEYAYHLEFFLSGWGLKFSDLYLGGNLVMSYLRNEDGSFKNLFNTLKE